MKNHIYKHNLKKLISATLFVTTRHTQVSNMGTLSQTMARGWSYLGHLTRNLYMSIDDWPFCEEVFWKLCQNSGLSFFLATSTHKRSPCQRISLFEYFFIFFIFFEKNGQNGPCAIICDKVSIYWHIGVSWYRKHCCQKQFLKYYYKYYFPIFKCQKQLFKQESTTNMLQKVIYMKKRWNGCHIWIPLFFLIDLDILFVKFQFIDLKIWIIPY